MRYPVLALLTSACISSVYAQQGEDWRLYQPTASEVVEVDSPRIVMDDMPLRDKGSIRYIQDESIGVVDEYLEANPLKQDGYRIQLLFGSRSEVSSSRSRFLSKWRYAAYETYLAPNFRLRVGDFITRFQAEKALRELRESFPNAYIVRDKIEVPEIYQ